MSCSLCVSSDKPVRAYPLTWQGQYGFEFKDTKELSSDQLTLTNGRNKEATWVMVEHSLLPVTETSWESWSGPTGLTAPGHTESVWSFLSLWPLCWRPTSAESGLHRDRTRHLLSKLLIIWWKWRQGKCYKATSGKMIRQVVLSDCLNPFIWDYWDT